MCCTEYEYYVIPDRTFGTARDGLSAGLICVGIHATPSLHPLANSNAAIFFIPRAKLGADDLPLIKLYATIAESHNNIILRFGPTGDERIRRNANITDCNSKVLMCCSHFHFDEIRVCHWTEDDEISSMYAKALRI